MFEKGFLNRASTSKEKGDGRKKNQEASDKSKPLDMIKEASRKSEVKLSQDKAQQSDVGTSSNPSKKVEIPKNFEGIGGNTELANAQVVFLGETHTSQHHKAIVEFINDHAKKDDIILVEGVQAGQEVDQCLYEKLTRKVYKIDVPFIKGIKIYGCDDMEAYNEQYKLISTVEEYLTKRDALNEKRNNKILDTINEKKKSFPDNRLFIIAGRNHFTDEVQGNLQNQRYIALIPKCNLIEKDREDPLHLYTNLKKIP